MQVAQYNKISISNKSAEFQDVIKKGFLSNTRIKKLIREWRVGGSVVLAKLDRDTPTVDFQVFRLPDDIDKFMVELASLSDLHGLVKLENKALWMKPMTRPEDLNVGTKTMERIYRALTGRSVGA